MATKPVSVNDNNYEPQSLDLDVGDTVEWTWVGNRHSVTSYDNLWPDTKLQDAKHKFSFTFDTAGNFKYHCTNHTSMKGIVNVGGAEEAGRKKY